MMQHSKLRSLVFLFAATAWIVSSSIAVAQSIWEHNGSQVRLEAQGNARKFIYETVRQGLSANRGDVLFEGSRNGKTYSGTAYLFSGKCGTIAYKVTGEVGADDRSVTMSGKAPRRDANCQVTSYVDDKLSFTLANSNAPNLTSNSAPNQSRTTEALSSPLTCQFNDVLKIIACHAQSDNIKVDEIKIKDQISSTCRQFYYESNEKVLINVVLARLAPQEREALDKNVFATLSYLRESKRFSAQEMQIIEKYVGLNAGLRYDAYVKPLRKGEEFFITFQSCPAIDSVEVVINGRVYGVWRR